MTDIIIASAARTPVGSFNGAFANLPAHDLGAVAIKAALERANLTGKEVDEVILGQVLTAGQGQNPARQAAMKAGIPEDKTAWSLNQVCGSGLRWACCMSPVETPTSSSPVARNRCRYRRTRLTCEAERRWAT